MRDLADVDRLIGPDLCATARNAAPLKQIVEIIKRPKRRQMRPAGLVVVVPSRDGDLESKKASRARDDNATYNVHNHAITLPVFVEFVKAA